MRQTRQRRAIRLLVALLALLTAAGCTRTIAGTAMPNPGGVKKDAPPSDFPIEGGDGSPTDQLVANSMDDITTYWEKHFKEVFGTKLQPLAGGVHAYEPNQSGPIPCFADNEKKNAANNAFYCPTEDAIAYDRSFVTQLAKEFGDFIVPLVFAHEFGHAIQARVGLPGELSISWEGQADCYAGVFTKAASEGTAHFQASTNDLDTVLGGYLMLRDEPGYSAQEGMAHGSAFDRVGAFQEGFLDGAKHCKTAFSDDREYTEIPYVTSNDKANEGNLGYQEILSMAPEELNQLGATMVSGWQEVAADGFDGNSAKCDGKTESEMVFYCPEDSTVYFADAKLAKQAYDKYGDLAVVAVIGLGYTDAILEQSKSKKKDADAFKAELCLLGAYSGAAFTSTVDKTKSPLGSLQLSAGDLDEVVALLIGIGEQNDFVNTHGMDGFDRVNVFREAVQGGREDATGTAKGCLK